MTKSQILVVGRWRVVAGLALFATLNGCPDVGVGLNEFKVRYHFINNSSASAIFHATNFLGLPSQGTPVAAGTSVGSGPWTGETEDATVHVSTWVVVGGQIKGTTDLDVPIGNFQTTTVTVIWDGTALSVSVAAPCSPSASAAPTPFDPGVAACPAPTTWTLVGITGTAAGNFQDLAATASGTLTLTVPPTVEEGETVAVSATFSGTVTVNPGWNGYSTNATVGIVDRGFSGLSVNNSTSTGPITGSKSQSVTVNGAWIIPKNQATLALEAGGNFTMAGTGAKLIATYSKQP